MEPLVFGLDIGTRNVVGTVGYKEGTEFIVVAQYMKEHETRAMLDGQIHDIGRVAKTIETVKQQLEEQIGTPLTEVCIAAAGRVLKTVTTTVEYEYDEETVVTREDIHTLDLLGIEKASGILKEENDTKFKFYCVGYSVVKYYLNDDIFSNLEGHKADRISEDIIVTFLPEDVVDGLYSACNLAGLEVANMTLEPIAAINVAIPEAFRMLNIILIQQILHVIVMYIRHRNEIFLCFMFHNRRNQIFNLTRSSEENLTLTILHIFLNVKSNSFCYTKILHRLRDRHTQLRT